VTLGAAFGGDGCDSDHVGRTPFLGSGGWHTAP
jgi:hypothetical protein